MYNKWLSLISHYIKLNRIFVFYIIAAPFVLFKKDKQRQIQEFIRREYSQKWKYFVYVLNMWKIRFEVHKNKSYPWLERGQQLSTMKSTYFFLKKCQNCIIVIEPMNSIIFMI